MAMQVLHRTGVEGLKVEFIFQKQSLKNSRGQRTGPWGTSSSTGLEKEIEPIEETDVITSEAGTQTKGTAQYPGPKRTSRMINFQRGYSLMNLLT